jgi:4-hydroxy-tetrahydrodipicolinate synthase
MTPGTPTTRQRELDIHGNIPAAVTPFSESGAILFDAFADVLRWHLRNGVDGICIAGDNGEAWSLSADERRLLAETTVREVAGRVPVIMGASAITARQTIALAEIAAAAGVDALLIQPQSYVIKSTPADLIGRYRALAQAVPLPLVVYNSPRRTGMNIDVPTLRAICDIAPVVALKESSRDFFHLTHVLEEMSERIAILTGPCPFIMPSLALGARGFISTGPEFLGPRVSRIMALGGQAPTPESKQLHFTLTAIYEALTEAGTWPAPLKAALAMIDVPAGVTREPVGPLSPDAERKLRDVLQRLDLVAAHDAARAGRDAG